MNARRDESGSPEPLDQRTERFAQAVRVFVRKLPRTISNAEDVKQLVRASGSVAANLIEANEAISKKDYILRPKYCREEAKESRLWLALVHVGDKATLETDRAALV
jgi:four helix bundle protein